MITIATEYSFDVLSRVDMAEVQNAVQQGLKEVATRYDFKGGDATIVLNPKEGEIQLEAADDQQMRSLLELVQQRLARRKVSLRALDVQPQERAGGDRVRRIIRLRQGIPAEKAREIIRFLRERHPKVKAQQQDDQIRVSGPKKDELQSVMATLRAEDFGLDLDFANYR